MIKYEYKKGKFIKNGHTMFESDVLTDLKRLAYLEDQRSKTLESSSAAAADVLALPAALAVINLGYAATGFLVRRFNISYITAMYLMQILEDHKIVGPFVGAKNRKILKTAAEAECIFI